MTIDLSACQKPQLKSGFGYIIKGAAIMADEFPEEYGESLSEIETCFQKAVAGETAEPHWADVLVDIVLSFLPRSGSKSNPSFEKGIQVLGSQVTPAVVESIRAALTSTDREDDEDEEEDESDDEDANAMDEAGEKVRQEDQSSDEEDEDESGEEMEEDETELDKFKQKLQSILTSDAAAEEDEEVLGDDAMEELDAALGEAFKERLGTTGKKALRHSKKEQDDFRCRVLNIYAAILHKREVELDLILPLIPLLVTLTKTVNFNPGSLAAKVLTIFNRIIKLKHVQKSHHVDGLAEAVEACFAMTARNMPAEVQAAVPSLIEWLLKISKNTDSAKEVDALARELVAESVERKTFNKTFFTNLSLASETFAFALIESRVERAFDPNVKSQKRSLESDVIATALTKVQFIPDSLFNSLWQKVTVSVADLMAQEKPHPNLLAGSLRIMSRLKCSKQGADREVDKDLLDKLSGMSAKMKKKMPKSGQKALKTFVKYDDKKRSEDSLNAKRRRDNPYLGKKRKQSQVTAAAVAAPTIRKQAGLHGKRKPVISSASAPESKEDVAPPAKKKIKKEKK